MAEAVVWSSGAVQEWHPGRGTRREPKGLAGRVGAICEGCRRAPRHRIVVLNRVPFATLGVFYDLFLHKGFPRIRTVFTGGLRGCM